MSTHSISKSIPENDESALVGPTGNALGFGGDVAISRASKKAQPQNRIKHGHAGLHRSRMYDGKNKSWIIMFSLRTYMSALGRRNAG